MVQAYDYETNKIYSFNNIDSLCEKFSLKKKNVIKSISRETKIYNRYIISYGKICEQLIIDKTPKTYILKDLITDLEMKFNSFSNLVNHINDTLNTKYPINHFHRNMARGYISYKRFKIIKTSH